MDLISGAFKIFSGSSSAAEPSRLSSEQTIQINEHSTKILFLGRSGSGKTLAIETCFSEQGRISNERRTQSTTRVSASNITIDGNDFMLIDTIGFDNPTMSDLDGFMHLAHYLVDSTRIRTGITGIIYIHRAGDPVESRALAQNIRVLYEVFLGHRGLSRLTILVVSEHETDVNAACQIVSDSRTFRTLLDKGATIQAGLLNQRGIDRVLEPYASQSPTVLRIQRDYFRNAQINIRNLLRKHFDYYEESGERLVQKELKRHLESHTNELRSLKAATEEKDKQVVALSRNEAELRQQLTSGQKEITTLRQQLQESQATCEEMRSHFQGYQKVIEETQHRHAAEMQTNRLALKDKDSELLGYSEAFKQTSQLLAKSQEEASSLRQQLQQTQSEYGSLRSQLQLQENTEQSEIVRGLKDLNRDIDDIGRLISEYLSDNYLQKIFNKETKDVTALDAHQLSELKTLLGHTEGRSSIIHTSDGTGMLAEDFLDYATRMLLCKYLHQQVFVPFHPAAEPSHSALMDYMYLDIRHREPQAVAARWRVNCFKSIYKPKTADAISQVIGLKIRDFSNNVLGPMLTYFFGAQTELRLEDQHFDRLTQLFRAAWDWNWKLKGDIIILGDFHPTFYAPASRFDANLMDEYEPNPRGPQFFNILGTIGFGLTSSRALGGGKTPEETVVLKATVAMRNLYTA